jgi:hypothetical protein
MKPAKKTLATFEAEHGQPKLKRLQRQLEAEHAKVEALAGVQNKTSVEQSESCRIRFALTGDRHIGSLYHHGDALTAFLEYANAEDVSAVFDTGDILDGHRVYRGHEFELRDLGFEAQLARLAGSGAALLPTKFITGNHDASFKVAAGVSVGNAITAAAKGYHYLGEEQARHRWETPNGPFELMLLHPGGGSSYALSYRPQKIVESLEGGSKPDMLAIGHYHKAEFLPSYRNVAVVQTGTFQRQTPFMARQGLAAHVGGWIIDVTVGNGHNVVKGEFVAFFV